MLSSTPKLSAAALIMLLAPLCQANEQPVTHRYAIITSANDGGPGRTPLRFANSDAAAFSKVFEDLGGVDPQDRVLLLNATSNSLSHALDQMRERLKKERQATTRSEVIFYFSGHSDEQGLLFSDGRLTYTTLRSALGDLDANLRVAILDSCASGSFARSKGGKIRPPFMSDESAQLSGHVFLAASSGNEAAQESDSIRGSFFTHYLISALRGGADFTGDRRVTLNEAYQFAFNETLQRTTTTRVGAQHPAYDIDLTGSGDLVLTELGRTSATLVLPAPTRGRFYVRNEAGNLLAELNKLPGKAVELALDAGSYSVLVARDEHLYRSSVLVAANGGNTVLDGNQMTEVAREDSVARGDGGTPEARERYWFQPTISLGLVQHTLSVSTNSYTSLPDGGVSWGPGTPESGDFNGTLTGSEITFSHPLGNDYTVKLGYFKTHDNGTLDGRWWAIEHQYDIAQGYGAQLSFNVGIGGFQERLTTHWGYSTGSSSYGEGLLIPLGIQIKANHFVFEAGKSLQFMDFFYKPWLDGYNDNRRVNVTHHPIYMRLGYEFSFGKRQPSFDTSSEDSYPANDAGEPPPQTHNWFRPTVSLGLASRRVESHDYHIQPDGMTEYSSKVKSVYGSELIVAHPLGKDYTLQLALYGSDPSTQMSLAIERNWAIARWTDTQLSIFAGLSKFRDLSSNPHPSDSAYYYWPWDGAVAIPIGIKLQKNHVVFETGTYLLIRPVFARIGYEF